MENQKCTHCGEDCGKYPVMHNNLPFCCNGCVAVYQLLNQNKLYTYYQIENTPGIKIDQPDMGSKYAYLDNQEIEEKLLEFDDGEIAKITLYIPSIHCSSCIWLLEHLNLLNKGIIHSLVNFVKKEVSITYQKEEVSLRQIVELLTSVHYVPHISLEQSDHKKKDKSNRQLLYKIGIAGFAFGNIMLLSMPHYIPGKELIEASYMNIFAWISLALALPVASYCSSEYIISAYKNIKHGVININLPIAIGILALFIQSLISVILHQGPAYLDSLAGLVFFLLIGRWYQNKTYQALSFDRDYKSYFPVAVTKISSGIEEIVPLKNLKTGDHILVHNQELIPADAVLVKGEALIDYSFVTGESRSIPKQPGEELYAGGKQIGSAIELEIKKEVEQSKLTKIWNQENIDHAATTRLRRTIDNISKYFTAAILVIALATAILWLVKDPSQALKNAVAVLIVACPCALALSMPFTFGNTMRLLGKMGLFLKKTEVLELFARVTTIVFDKTGTLTHHHSENIKWIGEPLGDMQLEMIVSLCRQSAHPLSRAIVDEYPTVVNHNVEQFMELASSGIKGKVLGKAIKAGSSEFVHQKQDDVDSSTVHVDIDGEYLGYFSLQNNYRDGFDDLVNVLGKNYDLHVLTGDNDHEKTLLEKVFPAGSKLLFMQSPEDKLNYIKELQKKHKTVLMLGDGLNDAGALRQSDVGISIADDIYQFSPACDAILEAKSFSKLPSFLSLGRSNLTVLKVGFLISFIYNIVGLYFSISGMLSPILAAILMPLSSVSVVAFATLASSLAFNRKTK